MCVVIPFLAGIAPTTPGCRAIARRSPRARAAHESAKSRETTRPSERLRVTLVATHPLPSVDRHPRGRPAASRAGVRGRPPPETRGTRNSTYPAAPAPPVVAPSSSPSPPRGDAPSPGSTDRSSSHAKSTHPPRAFETRELHRGRLRCRCSLAAHFKRLDNRSSIVASRQRARPPPPPPIRRAGPPRDRPDLPAAQSLQSLHQVVRLVGRLGR